jgi:hypothetical protein
MHGIANKNFHVCRMPDRPSKLAHVNFARLFTHSPPRPDCGLTTLGRSDIGGHEPEAGMD